jgi:hypothetical protein
MIFPDVLCGIVAVLPGVLAALSLDQIRRVVAA